MIMEQAIGSRQKFVSGILPWIVAAAALVVYLVTLNHGVSFNGLAHVARLSGWTWQPELHSPLYWLLSYPLHWLPAKAVPLALNGFSALCAALTLALLARSVALLPHDRTQEQRDREKGRFALLSIPSAWQAPVLAALICGLQLSFWECATAVTGSPPTVSSNEMLDLLLFAYVIRCLLEFRIDERQSWLSRAAFVYGLGMTSNWAMWGFFPLFLAALVWIKGLSFFNLRFLIRMFLWGLAGLSLYLLLPAVQSLSELARVPFWQGLKANLGSQSYILTLMFRNARQTVLLLSLTSILPVFIIGIRWSSYFGDNSPIGASLATFMFHVVHALFLLACIWVALDPPLSPRFKGNGVPFLTFYYLGALSIGYLAGYFLLLARVKHRDRSRRTAPSTRLIHKTISAVVLALLFVAPALQIYKNLPQIRTSNGPMVAQFGTLLAQNLPPKGAVVLSDDPRRAVILQNALAQSGRLNDFLVLDTASLQWPDYQRFLKQRYPQIWPVDLPKGQQIMFDPMSLNRILYTLTLSNSVYYLHPSFGYFFEWFHMEPHGLVYKLQPFSTNTMLAPPVSQPLVEENETFWSKADRETLPPVQTAANLRPPGRPRNLADTLWRKAHLEKSPNRDASVLAGFYSRAADYWGVELQRAGHLAQAARSFERACTLNPDNLVAQVNLQCNTNLQAGHRSTLAVAKSVEDEFGKYRNWDQVVGENGPFDEPTYCYAQGRAFVQGGNYRQAAHQFERTRKLALDHLPARLLLAQIYVVSQRPDDALDLMKEIRSHADLLGVQATNQADLLFVEASAHLSKNDLQSAEAVVQNALRKYPRDETILGTATQVFMKYGQFSNALAVIDAHLKVTPDDRNALINKGYTCLQLSAFEKAIPPLTRALNLETNTASEFRKYALLNRAVAYLRSNQLEAAQRDYETLQGVFTNSSVYYGLAEIAYRKKDTNTAIRNYQLYLTNAPANPEEIKLVNARLQELTPGSP